MLSIDAADTTTLHDAEQSVAIKQSVKRCEQRLMTKGRRSATGKEGDKIGLGCKTSADKPAPAQHLRMGRNVGRMGWWMLQSPYFELQNAAVQQSTVGCNQRQVARRAGVHQSCTHGLITQNVVMNAD